MTLGKTLHIMYSGFLGHRTLHINRKFLRVGPKMVGHMVVTLRGETMWLLLRCQEEFFELVQLY